MSPPPPVLSISANGMAVFEAMFNVCEERGLSLDLIKAISYYTGVFMYAEQEYSDADPSSTFNASDGADAVRWRRARFEGSASTPTRARAGRTSWCRMRR